MISFGSEFHSFGAVAENDLSKRKFLDLGTDRELFVVDHKLRLWVSNVGFNTCVPATKCDRRPHFGAVGIAGLYIGRLRNCLPFLTSFTQCRMANLHIKCFDINAYQ